MEFAHTSVLLNETIEGLAIRPDGIYVDGTLGGGGHASVIAGQLKSGKLIGIDQDDEAIAAAEKRLAPAADKVVLVRDNYCSLRRSWMIWDTQAQTGSCWIWGFPPGSLTARNAGFPIGLTRRWTCGWTGGSP